MVGSSLQTKNNVGTMFYQISGKHVKGPLTKSENGACVSNILVQPGPKPPHIKDM